MDSARLRKLSETLWMFWAFALVGFDNAVLGPCLPDLQARVGASLDSMSFVFVLQGIGFLTGLLIGLLLDRNSSHRRFLIGVYVFLGSAANMSLPMVPHFAYLLSMFFLQGVTKGLVDFGVLSLCNVLHENNKAVVLQFVVTGAGVGTFLTPFIAKPFVNDHLTTTSESSSAMGNASGCIAVHREARDVAREFLMGNTSWREPVVQQMTEVGVQPSGADVRIPFVIIGAMAIPAGVAFLYFHYTNKDASELLVKGSDSHHVQVDPEKSKGATMGVNVFRVLVAVLHFPVFGMLITYAGLLTTLGALSPLCMTPQEMSFVIVVLWASFSLGRVINIAMVTCIPPFLLITLNSIGLIITGLVLLAKALEDTLVLWFATAGFGFFLSPFLPGFMSWSNGYYPISGAFINACLFISGLGEMLLPFAGSLLLTYLSGTALLVFLVSVSVVMFCLFLLTSSLARRLLTC